MVGSGAGLGFWWGIVIIAEVLEEREKAEFADLGSGNSALRLCYIFYATTNFL